MKMTLFDAIDLFSQGGYFDKALGRYIPSRDYFEKRKKIFPNTEMPDYDQIRLDPKRYILAPCINSFAVNAKSAMDLGVTEEELMKMGCSSEMYKNDILTLNRSNNDLKDGYSDEEWGTLNRIEDYIRHLGKYEEYTMKITKYRREIMKRWLKNYDVDIVDD